MASNQNMYQLEKAQKVGHMPKKYTPHRLYPKQIPHSSFYTPHNNHSPHRDQAKQYQRKLGKHIHKDHYCWRY